MCQVVVSVPERCASDPNDTLPIHSWLNTQKLDLSVEKVLLLSWLAACGGAAFRCNIDHAHQLHRRSTVFSMHNVMRLAMGNKNRSLQCGTPKFKRSTEQGPKP